MKFRIFSNDRRSINGVHMYSALMAVDADTAELALMQAPAKLGSHPYAPMVAIEWPATAKASKTWLDKHVNASDAVARSKRR
jgi:hypothetical protein